MIENIFHSSTLSRSIIAKDIISELKQDIITKKLLPGEKLTESVLSKRYSVSRVPIRSALRVLAEEGFLESRKNGVHYVPHFTVKFFEDIFEVRGMLEKRAVEITLKSDFVDYSPLLQSLSLLKEQARLEKEKSVMDQEALSLPLNIHYQIVAISENKALLKAWMTTSKFNQIFMDMNMQINDLEYTFNEDNILCSSIIQKQPDCLDVLEEHISVSKDLFIGLFKEVYGAEE